MNHIGDRVCSRRHHLKESQDALCARIANVTHGQWNPAWQDISRIEHGARIITDLELLALAQALDCAPCWLLLGDEER
ncbi:MAG TPA: hypothetical protein VGL77_08490 [Armatimonadota bacterium]